MHFSNVLSVMTLKIVIFSKNISQLEFENFFYNSVHAYRDIYHNFSYSDIETDLGLLQHPRE